MTPLDVLLLSYIKGCFVYCPFLLVQFSDEWGIFYEKVYLRLGKYTFFCL